MIWPLCTALWAGLVLREGLQEDSLLLALLASAAVIAALVGALLAATERQDS